VGDKYVLTATVTTIENIAREQEVKVDVIKEKER
jgi:hypothetical protein